ncbi:MAG: NAD(P)H-dependent glycerol-3-phosphate dehydrogenase [bacterium]
MRITVLGAGGWGTTLAILLHFNGHQVAVWEFSKSYARTLNKSRINKTYLPGIKVPEEIKITSSLEDACEGSHMIVLAVPTQFIRSVLKKMKKYNFNDATFVSVIKGIENSTLMTVSQIIKEEIPQANDNNIAVLSGPSHAEEVSRKVPTAVVVASKNKETAKGVQAAFMTSYFRVYYTTDIIGVELGGALKNIIAIGAGIVDGAGFGDNTKAAIMTRGVHEITKLGIALGAKLETFAGLSGMGDLIVTCGSKHSRNRYVGEQIGKGKKLKDVIKSMEMVAEGVETCRSTKALAAKTKVETPIINAVYSILFEEKDPHKATYDLMTRDMKPEYSLR